MMDPINLANLANLHDIAVPAPVSWLPPAPGIYAAAFTLLLILGWLGAAWYRFRQRNRYRREALAEVARLKQALKDPVLNAGLLPQLPRLLKRTALAAYGRQRVAALDGDDWLDFLDKTGRTETFRKEAGKLLLACDYQPAEKIIAGVSEKEVTALVEASRHWIARHRPDNARNPGKSAISGNGKDKRTQRHAVYGS